MELKPCPFCGETPPEDSYYDDTKWGGIQCCCQGPDVRTDYKPWPHWKEAAIKEWNIRADPLRAALEALYLAVGEIPPEETAGNNRGLLAAFEQAKRELEAE